MNINLEKDFFEKNKNGGKFICIVGRRGSGKTWLSTNYIAISYKYNIYDAYYFILPEYETDANQDSYKFIEGHKNTYIYDTYSKEITENIKTESKNKKILYVLDDATGYLFENKNKPELIKLFTTCRHGKGITIILMCHALKSILSPTIRGMITYLFIGAFTNKSIIDKHLWEDNCSMMISKEEFINEYKEKIIDKDHNFLFIDDKCRFDFDVDTWELSNFDRNEVISKEGKVNYIKTDKNYKIINKIKDKKEYKKMEKSMLEPQKINNNLIIKFNKSHKK